MGEHTALRRSADFLRIQAWVEEHEREIARSDFNRRYLAALPTRDTDRRSEAVCATVEAWYAQEAAGWKPRVFLPGRQAQPSVLARNLTLSYLAGRWCPPGLKPVADPWNATELAALASEVGGFDWLPVTEPGSVRSSLSLVKSRGYYTSTPAGLAPYI